MLSSDRQSAGEKTGVFDMKFLSEVFTVKFLIFLLVLFIVTVNISLLYSLHKRLRAVESDVFELTTVLKYRNYIPKNQEPLENSITISPKEEKL